MKNYVAACVLFTLVGAGTAAVASERVDHFEGQQAETLAQAVTNFSDYNARMAVILQNTSLSAEDMQTIHELTYTLENALETINEEMTQLAGTLEALHVASETADYASAKARGAEYLEAARIVIP